MNTESFKGGMVGTILTAIGAGLSITEVQALVSIIATAVGLAITIVSSVIIPVWKKIRDARKDGKITPEEAEDIVDTAKKGIEDVKNQQEDKKDE